MIDSNKLGRLCIRLGKRMLIPFAVAIIGVQAVALASDPPGHFAISCEQSDRQFDDELFMYFATKDKSSGQMFRVFPERREVIIEVPLVKYIFDWEVLKTVRYLRFAEDQGVLEVELKEPMDLHYRKGFKGASFGTMPQTCWQKVVAAFGSEVTTEVVDLRP